MGNLSQNFSLHELVCGCGVCVPVIDEQFIEKLQKLRTGYGRPMIINSWYRCPDYNAKIGGSTNSMHCEGIAVDVACHKSTHRRDLVELAIGMHFRGIGVYDTWVHLDNRSGTPVMWCGKST